MREKPAVRLVYSVYLVCLVSVVQLNIETDRTDQIDQADWASRFGSALHSPLGPLRYSSNRPDPSEL